MDEGTDQGPEHFSLHPGYFDHEVHPEHHIVLLKALQPQGTGERERKTSDDVHKATVGRD